MIKPGEWVSELRLAARGLRRSPGFTVAAVLTLALGIGGTTAMFSVVYGVLFRPLPYPDAERIVVLQERRADGTVNPGVSEPQFVELAAQSGLFSAAAALDLGAANLTGGEEPERVVVMLGSGGLFGVLGVPPQVGRPFGQADAEVGATPVALISDGLWRRRFAGAGDIVGRRVELNGETVQVIGVLPREVPFVLPQADVWRPLIIDPQRWGPDAAVNHNRMAVARLLPGLDAGRRDAAFAMAAGRLQEKYPQSFAPGWTFTASPLLESMTGQRRRPLWLFLGAVGMVLLIASSNVANLFLLRGERRRADLAVRVALGASRAWILRGVIAESLVVSALAGALGVAMAGLGLRGLLAALPRGLPRLGDVHVDAPVLAAGAGLAVCCGLLSGLLPALALLRREGLSALGRARGATASGGRRRMRRGLVVAEMALALMLTVGAGLLLRSLSRLLAQDPGFDAKGVAAVTVNLPLRTYPSAEAARGFYRRALDRALATPGVESAAAAISAPLDGANNDWAFEVEGRTSQPVTVALYNLVTPDYFSTLRIAVRSGRGFTGEDERRPEGAVIVNQALARQVWPGESPLGKRLNMNLGPPVWREVVGVVADTRTSGLGADVRPQFYLPMIDVSFSGVTRGTLLVRGKGDPAVLGARLAADLRALDPAIPRGTSRPLAQIVAQSVAQPRFALALLAGFAGAALLLGAIGVYGVVSASVRERGREFGVRMALGGTRLTVLRLVVREGLGTVLVGVVLGSAGAAALGRLLGGLLFGVSPLDVPSFAAAALSLAVVAGLACLLPAWRAASLDPMAALREE